MKINYQYIRGLAALSLVFHLGMITSANIPAASPQKRKPTPVKRPAPAAKKPAASAASSANNVTLLKPVNFPKVREAWKGQVVVLNFWATWCAPCVAEMPEFIKLHNEYKDKGVKVVSVSADDSTDLASLVVPFVKQKGMIFENYLLDTDDPQEMLDQINKDWPGTLPSTFVYDKTGKLIYSKFSLINRDQLVQVIENALK